MFKKIIIITVLLFVGIGNIHAISVSPKIEGLYNKFYSKIEVKYDIEQQNTFLTKFNTKLLNFKNSNKYRNNKPIVSVLEQFIYLNNSKITDIRKKILLGNIKSSNIYEDKLQNEIRRNKEIFDKYSYSNFFKNISYTDDNIFLENGVWYTYSFNNYSTFPKNAKITKKDLEYNGINSNSDLLFLTYDKKLGIAKQPIKVRLISDNIIKNIKNKHYFLKEVKDDYRINYSNNYDNDFIKLKNLTEKLTNNLSKDSQIKNIYNYVLKNTKYSSTIDLKDYKIFSGIETFKNNDGVCEGYGKVMVYMLMFAGFDDTEVIRGYVIDAQDFPKIGHAWVKLDGVYYDPTFDDPVGAGSDKNIKDYKYYSLPKDLFYTNRYNTKDLPENIKTLSLVARKNLITQNLYNVYEKYKNNNFNLLKTIKIKKENGINFDQKIGINNLSKILPQYTVNDFSFSINGLSKRITKINYYDINDDNIEGLIEQLKYDLDGYYYFKWIDKKGNISYKLAYNVEFK